MKYAKYFPMNLYAMNGRALVDEIQQSVIHFAKKHGVIPDVVLLHPTRMDPELQNINIQNSDTGEQYVVEMVADPGQLLGCFMVCKEQTTLVAKRSETTTPARVQMGLFGR